MIGVRLVGAKHALCSDCEAVLHVPWAEASDVVMAVQGWSHRLRQGCRDCGGRLKAVKLDPCPDCQEWLSYG